MFLGIIGGMGPQVLITFCKKIIKYKNVDKEQDHIPFIAISDPTIDDRTSAILNNNTDPVLIKLNKLINKIINDDITNIILLCNTIHYWIPQLQLNKNISIINLIELTQKYVYENLKNDKIMLLATIGTYKTKIYFDYFSNKNLMIPNDEYQQKITNIIYDCKLDLENTDEKLKKLIIDLGNLYQIKGVILGCTELSILLENYNKVNEIILIDPIEISARYIVDIS